MAYMGEASTRPIGHHVQRVYRELLDKVISYLSKGLHMRYLWLRTLTKGTTT